MTVCNSSTQMEYQNGIQDFAKRGAWKVSSMTCPREARTGRRKGGGEGYKTFSFRSFESGPVRGFMELESVAAMADCSRSPAKDLFFNFESYARSVFRLQCQCWRVALGGTLGC